LNSGKGLVMTGMIYQIIGKDVEMTSVRKDEGDLGIDQGIEKMKGRITRDNRGQMKVGRGENKMIKRRKAKLLKRQKRTIKIWNQRRRNLY
jgi:hypothetical protein